ncbi:glycosyltransferase [Bifidobacterium saeculare]|uniref:glycosyltransferase family 2 protein n=1 Tax=Bifidobacterium pullorum TaxID=78448 RepID=UPI0018745FFC|nr:glycosyltransferase family 2 protein [Bifidobacterium pullorum]MBE5065952.1 glycosyltransferase [Bifidobacterium pullorum subsp. saeculare]
MSFNTPALVSVIVPVYNAEQYLPYCIDSILGQSYPHLEVILVDDGATDASPQICDEYAAKDQRVEVIHQCNGGIAKAQNAGLDAAHGEYIAFVDNDDIVDRHNIEYLLHALIHTGADMSKARWQQFGLSQLDTVIKQAQSGATAPTKITVFRDPLRAYQTVFCKSLRMLGTALGHDTEAKYFNEANWCRLYKRELWEHLRFPEGVYAQDTALAGDLYARMDTVADINVSLYNWLQRPESVTHRMRSSSFFHDHVQAAAHNFQLCAEQGITPMRSYYTLTTNLRFEQRAVAEEQAAHPHDAACKQTAHIQATSVASHMQDNQAVLAEDCAIVTDTLQSITMWQRLQCEATTCIRLLEKRVYDRTIKSLN